MTDISASLLSWLKLTGKLSSISAFSEIGDSSEFISIYEELFPEIESFKETSLFINHISSNIPMNIRGDINKIDNDEFESCDPDLLENIAKIYLFMMFENKREILMRQIDKLDDTEKSDLFSLLSINEQKEEENLGSLAETLRSYSRAIDESLKCKQEEDELNGKINKMKEMKPTIIKQKKEEVRSDYEHQLEAIKQIYTINIETEKEISELQNKCEELEKYEQEKQGKMEQEHKLLHEKSSLESKLKEFQNVHEKKKHLDEQYNEFNEQKDLLDKSVQSLTKINSILMKCLSDEDKYSEKVKEMKRNQKILDLFDELDKKREERDMLIKELEKIRLQLGARGQKI